MADHGFTSQGHSLKKQTRWSNDKTIIRLPQIIDLLPTDKSWYFAQPRPIIVNYLKYTQIKLTVQSQRYIAHNVTFSLTETKRFPHITRNIDSFFGANETRLTHHFKIKRVYIFKTVNEDNDHFVVVKKNYPMGTLIILLKIKLIIYFNFILETK